MLARIGLAMASAGLTVSALEGGLSLLLSHPGLLPEAALPMFRQYYRNREWLNLQLEPSCAVYDPLVTYTLRPGEFRFGGREFDNAYSVNTFGLRDDEASLVKPEIIVLGDSHAMGWGVEQHESFPEQLARATGRRVLNAGIPSFGTVRELKLLERLDTSALTTLIIQYCSNDGLENREWASGGRELSIATERNYIQRVLNQRRTKEYFFGRHLTCFSRLLGKQLRQGGLAAPTTPSSKIKDAVQARLFVAVLASSSIDLSKVQVVVLEVNAHAENDRSFLDQLQRQAQRRGLPEFARRLITVDVSTVLTEDHYNVLDTHMRPQGHALVAGLLTDTLAREFADR
jgi:hypothetical protein